MSYVTIKQRRNTLRNTQTDAPKSWTFITSPRTPNKFNYNAPTIKLRHLSNFGLTHYNMYLPMKKIIRSLTSSTKNLTKTSKIILGIETSCDDTGCGIVNESGEVLRQALHSQNLVHLRYGGINPIVAQELHRDHIEDVVQKALGNSSTISDMDAIAVTVKPGLFASLQIGVKYANYLSKKFNKPLIPIHHMEAHALIARMYYDISFPLIVLLISGGHSILGVANDVDDFIKLGDSIDDAPGEAFDKVARRMKLRNIPEFSKLAAGRAVEIAASRGKTFTEFPFPLPLAKTRNCNFSFSGIKEALLHHLLRKEAEHNITGNGVIPEVYDLCAAFQLAVAEHIVHRTSRAIEFCVNKNIIPAGNKNLIVSGGVACNNFIFESLQLIGTKTGFNVFRPPADMCTDNGVMIAWNGVEKYKKGCPMENKILLKDVDPKAPFGKHDYSQLVEDLNIQAKVTRLKVLYDKI